MDTNLIDQAVAVDDTTMAIPQPVPDPIQIDKDTLVARMADRQVAMDGLTAADAIDQALLVKANALGLKTRSELAAETAPPEE